MSAVSKFVLRVPIDVSRVPDFTPGHGLNVLVWNRQGSHQQRHVTFERKGTVTAAFALERESESWCVALGPEAATPSDLRNLQTTFVAVPSGSWHSSAEVELRPIQVSAWDWWWWQHWRQSFRVTGRVVNAHGRPVSGATVSAFDIDAWWWWTAQEQVGSALTDSEGNFLLEFTRCCGWCPWWWWASRDWRVDPVLVERITGFVRQYPGLGLLAAAANSVPSLEIFQPLLTSRARPMPSALAATLGQAGRTIDPIALGQVRERLLEILPRRFPLPVWPWSEWSPWEDCGANLVFRVTETQGDRTVVLLNEGVGSTRWDIPASLDVKLIAWEATFCRPSGEWTLVDYLFPQRLSICTSQETRETSMGVLSTSSSHRSESQPWT